MTLKFLGGSDPAQAFAAGGGQLGFPDFSSFSAAPDLFTGIQPARMVPIGGFVTYTDQIPNAVNPNGVLVAAMQPGAVVQSSGSNYGASLGDGQAVTVNSCPGPAIKGNASDTLSTTVKPDGTITQTTTVSVDIEVSQSGLNSIINEVNTAVSAFANAVWTGLSEGANAIYNFVVGFANWVSGNDQGPGQHQQILLTPPSNDSAPWSSSHQPAVFAPASAGYLSSSLYTSGASFPMGVAHPGMALIG